MADWCPRQAGLGSSLRKRSAMVKQQPMLCEASMSQVIAMAWEDRTPFEAIRAQFALDEAAVIALMRRQLKPSSYRLWRQRVQGRKTKHAALLLLRPSER